MADVRGSSGVCNDRCACKEGISDYEHKKCSCGEHCGCNPCTCSKTEVAGTGGKVPCMCGVRVRRRVTSITSGALAGNIATVTHVAAARSNLLRLLKQAAGARAGAVAAAVLAARAPPVLPESK
ncbi:hypothetical protein Q3G72_029589 [Acer saccharum]|nr:hypothetical protein Q3G72_029589 [Acer saccharum]